MKLVLCDKMIRAVARRFQNPGSSQFPNHQIGAAVFDVEYIRNMTGAEFVFIFYAVSIWNQYLVPQIYLKDDGLKTIQQVLKNVVITDGGSGTTFKNVVLDGVTLNQQNLKAAAIFIAMLPIICVYPFVQKYFKKGILIGSVKG